MYTFGHMICICHYQFVVFRNEPSTGLQRVHEMRSSIKVAPVLIYVVDIIQHLI